MKILEDCTYYVCEADVTNTFLIANHQQFQILLCAIETFESPISSPYGYSPRVDVCITFFLVT